MYVHGKKDKLTGRIKILTMEPQSASDEFLITEIFRIMEHGHHGQIVVTHAHDNPEKIFIWNGDNTKDDL